MLKVDKTKLDRRLQLACMNYTALARAAGIRHATISKLANGHTVPRPATLRKITEVLDCTPADILQDVEEGTK